MTHMRIALLAVTMFGLLAASEDVLIAQGDDGGAKTIWDGVYTAEQAARGRKQFEISCGHCHADDLGGGEGPALIGAGFIRSWFEDSLASLYDYVRTTMPGDLPGSLSDEQSVDLTSFLLAANRAPPGTSPLEPTAEVLEGILIVGEDGPGPVPNFSMVQVVGCLVTVDDDWVLTHGTEPSRARASAASAAAAEAMAEMPLGANTIELMDAAYVKPDGLAGQKVLVMGLLIRQPEQVKINVTGLAGTGVLCEP